MLFCNFLTKVFSWTESFVKLPMYSYSQWLEDYRARWRSIVTLVDEIPLVDEQAVNDMVSKRWKACCKKGIQSNIPSVSRHFVTIPATCKHYILTSHKWTTLLSGPFFWSRWCSFIRGLDCISYLRQIFFWQNQTNSKCIQSCLNLENVFPYFCNIFKLTFEEFVYSKEDKGNSMRTGT